MAQTDFSGPVVVPGGFVGGVQGAGVALLGADGAIPVPAVTAPGNLVYAITKGSIAALTLAAPTAGAYPTGNDDLFITVYAETAFAHVITCASVGFDGKAASGTATWTAAKGNGLTFLARNGQWWVMYTCGVTIA